MSETGLEPACLPLGYDILSITRFTNFAIPTYSSREKSRTSKQMNLNHFAIPIRVLGHLLTAFALERSESLKFVLPEFMIVCSYHSALRFETLREFNRISAVLGYRAQFFSSSGRCVHCVHQNGYLLVQITYGVYIIYNIRTGLGICTKIVNTSKNWYDSRRIYRIV